MRKVVSLLLLVLGFTVASHATCNGNGGVFGFTIGAIQAGPTALSISISGVSNCYIIVTGVNGSVSNLVGTTGEFVTTVEVHQGNCSGSIGWESMIGVGPNFGATDHADSGSIQPFSTLGGGMCIKFGAGQVNNTEGLSVTYNLSSSQ